MVLADEVKYYALEFDIEQHPEQPQFYFEQPCRHLGADNRCGIFTAGRPFACGVYACKLLKEYLAGQRELEDCLEIITEVKRLIADLHAGQEGEGQVSSNRFRVWDYVGEFLAGNFEHHEGAVVDLRALDAEVLHQAARLSLYLEKHFISPGERGVSGNYGHGA